MAENSKIQWTDATWNPWHGCVKVSPGCKFCYMFRDKERYGQDPSKVIRSVTKFHDPLKWNDTNLSGNKIFTCSWSDFFIEEADKWRPAAWNIIKNTPELNYQILTKRPERIKDCLPDDWDNGYKNVWIGISVEDQNTANERIPILNQLPAYLKFISFEPLLEAIDLFHPDLEGHTWDKLTNELILTLDWAIIGGESGNDTGKYRYRECELKWIYDLMKAMQKEDIPVFIKQLGTHLAKENHLRDRHGGDLNEWPALLQIREFPKTITS